MELHLPDKIANRIQKFIEAKHGHSPLEIVEKALDSFDGEIRVANRFASYRGMAAGWSVENMLKDRREGLD